MKKIILVIAAVLCMGAAASAQSRALGLRITNGAEVSYQHSLGMDFVEADLGWYSNGFYLSGIYNFVFAEKCDFNFYAGPGASLGYFNSDSVSGFNLGIAGMIGMEYNFNIPLQLSLDWRPVLNLFHGGFGWQGIALGVRYRF